jgi:hypothetical protein
MKSTDRRSPLIRPTARHDVLIRSPSVRVAAASVRWTPAKITMPAT